MLEHTPKHRSILLGFLVKAATKEILGETCYPDLKSVREPVDVVDIFRRAEEVPVIVEDAIGLAGKTMTL